MKNYWKSLLPVCIFIGLQSCGNAERKDRDETATSIIDSLSDTTQRAHAATADVELNGDGKVFVLSAATGVMMELEVAVVANKKSKNKAVKDFAARMLKDYGLADQELNQISSDKGILLPKTLPKELAGSVAGLKGLANRAFDLQYIRMMIGDHQKTVQFYTDGAKLTDSQLRAFAVKMLPIMKKHYQSAVEIGKSLNMNNVNNGDDVLGISPAKVEKK
ncbi:putative membrane protein [Pedobacter sp. AK017]|uniref:DUF4142 domain-containing protein n=1 Tax=Pedobacter sp. AK017 TaxID=2723073 RepID=UPI00160BCCA2|nr:DUF4142 domain-containing protein [Pedobacter sp. AK017]MBB5437955.1 putative membrane protein [Pedobacter sp. AK017]